MITCFIIILWIEHEFYSLKPKIFVLLDLSPFKILWSNIKPWILSKVQTVLSGFSLMIWSNRYSVSNVLIFVLMMHYFVLDMFMFLTSTWFHQSCSYIYIYPINVDPLVFNCLMIKVCFKFLLDISSLMDLWFPSLFKCRLMAYSLSKLWWSWMVMRNAKIIQVGAWLKSLYKTYGCDDVNLWNFVRWCCWSYLILIQSWVEMKKLLFSKHEWAVNLHTDLKQVILPLEGVELVFGFQITKTFVFFMWLQNRNKRDIYIVNL